MVKHRLQHLDLVVAMLRVLGHLIEFFLRHREKFHLVERSQQPRMTLVVSSSVCSQGQLIPDRNCSSHQLVATRRLHGVDAHVHASNANGAVGRERSGRIVLGAEEPVTRVQRHGARSTQKHVSQAKDQEPCRVQHVLDGRPLDAVDLRNEVDVVGQPWRAGSNCLGVPLDGVQRLLVLKRHRQSHNT
ncbi:hypothetical protein OGATHE_000532 [Ogataea polymorpha]|uniref:Uncharacterized protein n=1 Tax=Ogataea polymorpha TaxID=460523 RepID=A0A9P8PT11_9ASCO|nr:hypothetical protein OGATHE_000532 [Ogataea polymorpha]